MNKTGETGKTGAVPSSPAEGDLLTIVVGIREFYRKYVAFHSDHELAQSGAVTLYTLYTHVYEAFRFAPILLVTAPTSESGKSRLFDVAELLVRMPYIVVDPSGPSVRNLMDLMHPVLMVDEADLLRQSRDLRALLNAGVERGRRITRAGRNGGVVEYDPFGPKMLAGIYGTQPPLKGATLSRCIQIGLRRRNAGTEDIADFDKDIAEDECAGVRAALDVWAKAADREAIGRARPAMPAELTDRQRDAWRPLAAVADLISPMWGEAARLWAVELSRAVPVTPDLMVQVLKDCYRVLASPEHSASRRITTEALATARNALPDREYDADLNPIALAKRLDRFEIHPERYYADGRQVRGFLVRNERGQFTREWSDAIGRYRLDE